MANEDEVKFVERELRNWLFNFSITHEVDPFAIGEALHNTVENYDAELDGLLEDIELAAVGHDYEVETDAK